MCMAMVADIGVEISGTRQIKDNIFHQLIFRRKEGELTPVVFFASEVDNLQHGVSPLPGQAEKPGWPDAMILTALITFGMANRPQSSQGRLRRLTKANSHAALCPASAYLL